MSWVWDEEEEEWYLEGFRQSIETIRIQEIATDGVAYLEDTREIYEKYGLVGMYTFTMEFLDIE